MACPESMRKCPIVMSPEGYDHWGGCTLWKGLPKGDGLSVGHWQTPYPCPRLYPNAVMSSPEKLPTLVMVSLVSALSHHNLA